MTFEDWLKERKEMVARVEMIYDDFPEVKDLGKLRKLLRKAYNAGYAHCCAEDLEYD